MRQTLMPWAFNAPLFIAVFGREAHERMDILDGRHGPEEFFWQRGRCIAPAFDPHLIDLPLLPISEETDAVSGRYYLVEILRKRREIEPEKDGLTNVKMWLNSKLELSDNSKSPKIDHSPS